MTQSTNHQGNRSRQQILLIIGLALLSCLLNGLTKQRIYSNQAKIITAGLIVIVTVYLPLPQPYMSGKLRYFWRLIFVLCSFYLLILVLALLSQRQQVIDFLIKHVDSTLKPYNYEEASYAEDCRLIHEEHANPFQNVINASLDLFALGHFLGWFTKTLILRDFKFLMIASITFEAVEFSLRNVLNNFKECWWDHLLLDFSVFNFLGIICGFGVLRILGWKKYCWSLSLSTQSVWQSFKNFWKRWDLSNFQIPALATTHNVLKTGLFVLIILANDLTIFFLKYIYRIPPSNFLNFIRLVVVGFLCARTVVQYYDWLNKKSKGIKANLYLLLTILVLQIVVVWKHSEGQFSHAHFDSNGILLLGFLISVFAVLFSKAIISDLKRFYFQKHSEIEEQTIRDLG